ncbi:TnsA endonuclease N-terminal domain-containing protein [uncultured Celeribacter sp.]|uniref:TnsA endonuclease N-terminal domain-containing protein n=1 Tax=uncultured Celeribacter sp. TaxID=1303376 RepID=UPI002AA64D2F|nr:TnsA endonuclease N-terminal domain-containing protein [uncultured Celeribacter sp.]
MSSQNSNGFILPEPSRATRPISWKSRGSCRGSAVLYLGSHRQIVVYESLLELMCILLIISRGDVIDVWDQPPAIHFRRPDGSHHEHTPDYLVELADGTRFAVAVKPIDQVKRRDFDIELSYVAACMPASYADGMILMSDADFTRAQALNAQRYHEFKKIPDAQADQALAAVISQQTEPTTLEMLVKQVDLAGRGFRAAFRAIIEGRLRQVAHGKIGLQTLVMAEGAA